MKAFIFTSLIILSIHNTVLASDFCTVDWNKVIDHKGKRQNEEKLFKVLSKRSDCVLEDIFLNGFYSRRVKRIQFQAVTDWRGGIAASYLFQCTHAFKYGPDRLHVEDLGYSCIKLTN